MSEPIEHAEALDCLLVDTIVRAVSDNSAWQCMGGPVNFWTNGAWPATTLSSSELLHRRGAVVVVWAPGGEQP